MDILESPQFILFTGGPGVGKTTLLEALKMRGYAVVSEVARDIIKAQHASGGNATHQGDRLAYCELMLTHSIADYIAKQDKSEVVFFDRGLPDLYSYSDRFCGGVSPATQEAITRYRYNTQAFLFPPWPEIYCHDSERKQSYAEAVETYHAVQKGYHACGYQLIEIPKSTVEARVDFILKEIK